MSQPEKPASRAPERGNRKRVARPAPDPRPRRRRASNARNGAAGRALSAAQILAEARKIEPGLGHAMVYRTLHLLRQVGELRPFAPHHLAARYEIVGEVRGADVVNRNGELPSHHDRFECQGCQRAFDIETEVDFDAARLGLGNDFLIKAHRIIVRGLFPHCTSAPSSNQI